jgi:hypothetical protein
LAMEMAMMGLHIYCGRCFVSFVLFHEEREREEESKRFLGLPLCFWKNHGHFKLHSPLSAFEMLRTFWELYGFQLFSFVTSCLGSRNRVGWPTLKFFMEQDGAHICQKTSKRNLYNVVSMRYPCTKPRNSDWLVCSQRRSSTHETPTFLASFDR